MRECASIKEKEKALNARIKTASKVSSTGLSRICLQMKPRNEYIANTSMAKGRKPPYPKTGI